jgi:uncharacterized protein (TIRG00374 family)
VPASRDSSKRFLGFALRAIVGVGVVALLLARADVGELVEAVKRANVTLLVLGTVCFFASLLLSALRWEAFLQALELTLHRVTLVRLYLVGTFFNAFLPTGFGGDAYKAFILGKDNASIEVPLAAAALDRLAGMAGLALLTVLGVFVQLATGDHNVVTWVTAGVATALLIGCVVAVMWRSGKDRPARTGSGLRHRIRMFADALALGARHPHGLRVGSIWGVITAVLLVLAHGLLLAAVHGHVPAGALAGIVLLAALTTAIPLSINGLGFRETTYVWALGAYGVSSDTALLFALVVLAVTLLSSGVGGLVYAVSGSSLPRSIEDVEDGGDDQQVDAHQKRAD